MTQELASALGLDWNYAHPSEIIDEIARLTPTFAGVSLDRLDARARCNGRSMKRIRPGRRSCTSIRSCAARGSFVVTDYVPTDERTGPRFPLLLTTGRILSQYNVGAQTRRTENTVWHDEDVLEIHPADAENRGLKSGDWVRLASRSGETTLRALVTDRVAPGVVYTTFHHPATQANVVTTDYSDWATNCPEYKVTAVQIMPSNGPTGLAGRLCRPDRSVAPDRRCGRNGTGRVSRGTPERLAYMANQIAANLAREADPVAATADHIASFWTPAMYDRLIDAGVSNLDDTGARRWNCWPGNADGPSRNGLMNPEPVSHDCDER